MSVEPTVIYKPNLLLSKETIDSLSKSKEVLTGTETVDKMLKVLGAASVGFDCKNKVTEASAEA